MPTAAPAPRKTKLLSALIIFSLIALVVTIDFKRRTAEAQLQKLSVNMDQVNENEEHNKQIANQIIEDVRKLILLPLDTEPTVAKVIDIDVLRSKNSFYNKAENGDYLIVTADRAILYDPDLNIILDVVPVQKPQRVSNGSGQSRLSR